MHMPILDEIDRKILYLLKNNARISLTEVAKEVGLSVMGVKNRINRLEKRGIITSYSANIDYTKLGYNIIAFVGITAEAKKRLSVLRELKKRKEVVELYEVTGIYDFIAKIVAEDMEELRNFLALTMAGIDGVTATYTMVITKEHEIQFNNQLLEGK
ncbi:Lrp/AsnC family transcriptional regulator [Thermococcus sp. MV5]|uniref:Lrp/AsnC family transcriptional regulator n=1 Tax=Thermococcus sp. MV5 TaxID=1638272 RepID=UPI00143AE55D|nr:Lrp/AsnC family transcriptional regulator [Thermococcus sp. MV5]NJE26124.1 Lrp/AsnC family transcriptional regulator [Thermococcus sp. MV5]